MMVSRLLSGEMMTVLVSKPHLSCSTAVVAAILFFGRSVLLVNTVND